MAEKEHHKPTPAGAPMEMYLEYYKTKDPVLRNQIAELNFPLVTFIFQTIYAKPQLLPFREDILQEGQIGLLQAIEMFDPHRGFKFSTYSCVPLSTQILTQRGWKFPHEIHEGDKTIGYNEGKSEWTLINKVVTYPDAPLMRFGDSKWSTVCTPQHKWLIEEEGKVKLAPLTEWRLPSESHKTSKRSRLITSAPFVGGSCSLTPDEAAVLGWILSGGSLVGGRENPVGACIVQSEGKFLNEIRSLLERLGAYSGHDVVHGENCFSLNVQAGVFRGIWEKSGLESRSISDLVLDLTPDARQAWFNAWYQAEGTLGRRYIAQNSGEKMDALALCAFLEGCLDVRVSPKGRKCQGMTWHMRPRTSRRTVVKPDGHGPVWCPNTELGTWTARDENGRVFLTGNTWWIRQAISSWITTSMGMVRVPSHIRTIVNKTAKLAMATDPEVHGTQSFYSSGSLSRSIGETIKKNELGLTPKMQESVTAAFNTKCYSTSWSYGLTIKGGTHAHDGNDRAVEWELDSERCQEVCSMVDDHHMTPLSTDHQKVFVAFKRAFEEDLTEREQEVLRLRFNLVKSGGTP